MSAPVPGNLAVATLGTPPMLPAMKRRSVAQAVGLVGMLVLLTGCGGVQGSHSVSPASLLLPGLLITMEEGCGGDTFPDLTDWLLSKSGSLADRDLDDILHFVIDDLLDDLFPMLEAISQRLDALEESSLRNPRPLILRRSYEFRSNLRIIRTLIWPLRHQISLLLRQRQRLLGTEALEGFRDMAELVDQLFEACGTLRGQCDAITQSYAASVGNRMNQVMKTLTILTSIFAPLTFIVGIYGINFDVMPELKWDFGYPLALLLMALAAVLPYAFFNRKGWL